MVEEPVVVEAPMVEEPTLEAPMVEETALEAPMVEEPALEAPEPIQEIEDLNIIEDENLIQKAEETQEENDIPTESNGYWKQVGDELLSLGTDAAISAGVGAVVGGGVPGAITGTALGVASNLTDKVYRAGKGLFELHKINEEIEETDKRTDEMEANWKKPRDEFAQNKGYANYEELVDAIKNKKATQLKLENDPVTGKRVPVSGGDPIDSFEKVEENDIDETSNQNIGEIAENIDLEFKNGLNNIEQISKEDFEESPKITGENDIYQKELEKISNQSLEDLPEYKKLEENLKFDEQSLEDLPEYKKLEENLKFDEQLSEESDKDIYSLKKENYEEKEEESKDSEKNNNKIFENLSSLSDSIKQGFENVLKAIQDNKKEQNDSKKQTQNQEVENSRNERVSQEGQEKPKISQKNFIEEYRESLRTNNPINGYVGIKNLDLKVNNIGSYI
jgi:hypothetical protein